MDDVSEGLLDLNTGLLNDLYHNLVDCLELLDWSGLQHLRPFLALRCSDLGQSWLFWRLLSPKATDHQKIRCFASCSQLPQLFQ